ncbi:hypothetical protein HYC85_032140 [Camellia sinensis]|uniref:Secretory carrier-associated membrane protein n=1 Tax=Camellia sinensis TaxID=4442 RepID=A0A7J7FT56_CAMSI|nr:hypothetical protein HYC85_032140 [Camellia sinensis]
MATTNPFDLLSDDDNDDPNQLLQKLPPPPKKAPALAQSAAATQPAKLPSKPLPPAQADSTMVTIAIMVIENEWFKKGYKPPIFANKDVSLDDVDAFFNESRDTQNLVVERREEQLVNPVSMNAFEYLYLNLRDPKKKEKELAAWEVDLKRREREIKRREDIVSSAGVPSDDKNWPPCFPIIHHDIGNEILVHAQKLQYLAFASWLGIVLCLVFNVIVVTVCWIRGGGKVSNIFFSSVLWAYA